MPVYQWLPQPPHNLFNKPPITHHHSWRPHQVMTVSSCFNAAKESTAPTTWRTSTSCPWTEVASPPDSSWPQETTWSDWSKAEDGYARNSRMTYFQRLKLSADLVPGASSTNCLRPRPPVAVQGALPSASNAEKAKLEAQRWVTSPCLRTLGSQELIHSSGDQNKHQNLIDFDWTVATHTCISNWSNFY